MFDTRIKYEEMLNGTFLRNNMVWMAKVYDRNGFPFSDINERRKLHHQHDRKYLSYQIEDELSSLYGANGDFSLKEVNVPLLKDEKILVCSRVVKKSKKYECLRQIGFVEVPRRSV